MRTTDSDTNNYRRPMIAALVVGLLASVLAVVGLFVSGPGAFFQSYLFGFMFWLGISLGCLIILALHFLVSSRWGLALRRITEAGSGSLWLMAVLFIPLIIGLPFLYDWARPAEVAKSSVLQAQTWYLNVPFFIIRAVIYFLAWILLAFFLNRLSRRFAARRQDLALRGRLQGLGAFTLIAIAVLMSFAAVDWLVSLQTGWYSTAFGLVVLMGQLLTGLAFAILVLNLFPSLGLGRSWNYLTTPVPYQDLGALLLTFMLGWAYVAFFQLLIQWAGNIPHEVVWYVIRTNGGWNALAIIIAIFQFALPFFILLSIRARHNMRILAGLSGMLLLAYLINLFWVIKPSFSPNGLAVSWLDIVMPFAIGGLWLALFFFTLARRPALTPVEETILDVNTEQEKALP